MPKYSFVIPVYQVEEYLDECVASILKQTYQDYEIILVDDGSKDKSGEMCDAYASEHENIRVIHQKNAGAAAARNNGLENTTGDYVIFLDSDDYWSDADGLRKIDGIINEAVDVVAFASVNLNDETSTIQNDRYNYPPELNHMNPRECLRYMVEHDLLNMSAAKKVIRKEFMLKNGLQFKPGIRSEDVEWGIRLSIHLPRYRYLNEKLYVYRHRKGSVTKTVGEKHLEDYLWIVRKYADFDYQDQEIRNWLLSYVAYQYALLLAFITWVKPDKAREMLSELKQYTYLFQYTGYPRVKKISAAYRFVGFHGTRYLLALYLKRRMHN